MGNDIDRSAFGLQVVGDTGGGDDGPPVYLPTIPKAEQIIGGGSSADDIQKAKKVAASSPGPAYFPGSTQAVETFAQKKYNGTDSSPVIIPHSEIGTTQLAKYIVLGVIGGAVVIGAAITGGVMLRKRVTRR